MERQPDEDAPPDDASLLHGKQNVGFRAFTAKDWQRIEKLTPSTRAVGMMMQKAACDLVRAEVLPEGSCVSATTPTAVHTAFNEVHWRYCSGRSSSLDTAQASKSKPKQKQAQNRAAKIKESLVLKSLDADKERIRYSNKILPRLESFGTRMESWLASFEQWLKQPDVSIVDKMRSTLNVITMLNNHYSGTDAILTVLRSQLTMLYDTTTLRSLLDEICGCEMLLQRPSFIGLEEIQLYPEQQEVAQHILKALRLRLTSLLAAPTDWIKHACLLRFATPPSTGKSSAASYLGCLVQEFVKVQLDPSMRQQGRRATAIFVVYSCYSNAVRLDVAKACVASSVPFAIVTDHVACPAFACYNAKPRRRDPPPQSISDRIQYSLKILHGCDSCPVVLICDPESAIHFLQYRMDTLHTSTTLLGDVLILDEPTAFIEDSASRIPLQHARLLQTTPPITILMSATLPEFNELPHIVTQWRRTYNDLVCATVASCRLTSPCTLLDGTGAVFGPHDIIDAPAAQIHSIVTNNLQILRFYSPRALRALIADIPLAQTEVHHRIDTLSIEEILSLAGIRRVAVSILSWLPVDFRFQNKTHIYVAPDLPCMCTTVASIFNGTSIVISDHDLTFAEAAVAPLLSGIEKLEKHLKRAEIERNERSAAQVHCHGSNVRHGRDDRDDRVSKMERARMLDEGLEPINIWPAKACVNTKEHSSRFSSILSPHFYKTVPYVEDDILHSSNADLVESLLCGVAILESPNMDASYAIATLDMAEAIAFSYVCAGRCMIYGVNIPSDRVIVDLTIDNCTPAILKQALGRAGRTGKYTRSEAVFTHSDVLKMAMLCPSMSDRISSAIARQSLDSRCEMLSMK